jgi:hypothetical protein
MITLIPIEPLSLSHGALIVSAFSRLLIDRGGQPDGWGDGWGDGRGDGDGNGGYGGGYGTRTGGKIPDEWRVE